MIRPALGFAWRSTRGFTLLELTIVLGIMALLGAATLPYVAASVRNQAAEKTAREMLGIADAAKSYFVANKTWPTLTQLQAGGYLPAGWSATNPFGNPYLVSSGTSFTIATTVPTDVAGVTARLTPVSTQTSVAGGIQVSATWSQPGQSADLANFLRTPGDNWMFGPLQVRTSQTATGNAHVLNPDGTVSLSNGTLTVANGIIRGATYGFGGSYLNGCNPGWGVCGCASANPFTGACSCPGGFFDQGMWFGSIAVHSCFR